LAAVPYGIRECVWRMRRRTCDSRIGRGHGSRPRNSEVFGSRDCAGKCMKKALGESERHQRGFTWSGATTVLRNSCCASKPILRPGIGVHRFRAGHRLARIVDESICARFVGGALGVCITSGSGANCGGACSRRTPKRAARKDQRSGRRWTYPHTQLETTTDCRLFFPDETIAKRLATGGSRSDSA